MNTLVVDMHSHAGVLFIDEENDGALLGTMAEGGGVPAYFRAPSLGVSEAFIQGLAGMVRDAVNGDLGACVSVSGRLCPSPMCGQNEGAI